MENIKLLILTIVMIASYSLTAQVAITTDGSSANNSAMLEVKSTSKGFLPPRMTSIQREAISSPEVGLMIFCTDDVEIQIYDGTSWVNMAGGAAGFNCGENFTDTRDSKTYATVQIGTQCWMVENLNVGAMINSTNGGTNNDGEQTDNSTLEKYCYENNTSNCDTYGGLYQWNEAMQYVTTEGVQGVCPSGWHLPTDGEWTTLAVFLGGVDIAGRKMKESGLEHWQSPNAGAANESGFTALPGGYHHHYGSYYDLTSYARFWSSSEFNTTDTWSRYLIYTVEDVNRSANNKEDGFSVRCLKD
jgi:uncharacterized protein (TIGR02145 family)